MAPICPTSHFTLDLTDLCLEMNPIYFQVVTATVVNAPLVGTLLSMLHLLLQILLI
jgi:hypothetical protein